MLSIQVTFLTGRYVATAHNDRDQPEWPPHPTRLFSALVATWAEADEPDPTEQAALEWLESQPPPSIAASAATPRRVVTHYVPVNDAGVVSTAEYRKRSTKIDEIASALATSQLPEQARNQLAKARDVTALVTNVGNTPERDALQVLPEGRIRQARSFPSVTPDHPTVTFAWANVPAPELRNALDGLLARVSRIGHSSSLVACRLIDDPPSPTHEPGPGPMKLRSVRSGQLAALRSEYEQHRASRPRSLPFTAVDYRSTTGKPGHPSEPDRPDTYGDWLIFEFAPGSRRLPSTRTVEVARAMRAAVFHNALDPLPAGLTGHTDDGVPISIPHVGFHPLPFVGAEHADGRLIGVAVSLPNSLDDESRMAALRAIGRWEAAQDPLRLTLGPSGVIELTRLVAPSNLRSLLSFNWIGPASSWVTATPIALPAHPGNLRAKNPAARRTAWARAEQGVVASCRHVGLPLPAEVSVSLDPYLTGARPAPRYPAFQQPGRSGVVISRRLVHVAVTFDRPAIGPMVLGAGRYLGLGLMRPVHTERGA